MFPNVHGGRLSADSVQSLLAKHVQVAGESCPSLKSKRVSPHVLRAWVARISFTAHPGSSVWQFVARAHATFSPRCSVSRMFYALSCVQLAGLAGWCSRFTFST